jgi:predicted nuclease with TOPRIM domain
MQDNVVELQNACETLDSDLRDTKVQAKNDIKATEARLNATIQELEASNSSLNEKNKKLEGRVGSIKDDLKKSKGRK